MYANGEYLLFPAFMTHKNVAERYSRLIMPVTAGFVNFDIEGNEVKISTDGESVSLKLKSDPNDAKMMNWMTRQF
jgi:hypothetical protein